jgi:hypothetical protein
MVLSTSGLHKNLEHVHSTKMTKNIRKDAYEPMPSSFKKQCTILHYVKGKDLEKKLYEKCLMNYDSGVCREFLVIPISLSRIPKISIRREFGNITASPIKLTVLHFCAGNFWNLSIKLHSDVSHKAEILMSITLTIYPNVSVCSFLIR